MHLLIEGALKSSNCLTVHIHDLDKLFSLFKFDDLDLPIYGEGSTPQSPLI